MLSSLAPPMTDSPVDCQPHLLPPLPPLSLPPPLPLRPPLCPPLAFPRFVILPHVAVVGLKKLQR
jgi:hypothetical protein